MMLLVPIVVYAQAEFLNSAKILFVCLKCVWASSATFSDTRTGLPESDLQLGIQTFHRLYERLRPRLYFASDVTDRLIVRTCL